MQIAFLKKVSYRVNSIFVVKKLMGKRLTLQNCQTTIYERQPTKFCITCCWEECVELGMAAKELQGRS